MNQPKCILLDIEGTTSSIRFVYDVMFPYIREHLAEFLRQNWESESVVDCLPLLATELNFDSAEHWLDRDEVVAQEQVASGVIRLMDDDVKATGLKKLQGAIWKNGFESGDLIAHLFDDVAEAIRRWSSDGIEIRIYSSGSVQAQKLFFGHTIDGNLLALVAGHYDTSIGPKQVADSYVAIAADARLSPSGILFISDIASELDAANEAGMQTVLSIRPGNEPVANESDYCSVRNFSEIDFSRSRV